MARWVQEWLDATPKRSSGRGGPGRSTHMRIVWADGHESLYELPVLRRSCPCAGCSGERGRPGIVGEGSALGSQQTTLADAQLLNRFGLQLIWADGHDDGLFSYALLRALCPCDACAGARMSR